MDGFAQVWETKSGATLGDAFLHRSEVTALCLSADDRWIAIGHKDGRVHLYDRATGYRIGPAFTHRASIQALTFLSDWRLLTGTIEQELGSWKLPSPKEGTEKELRRWLEKHSEVAPAVEPEL